MNDRRRFPNTSSFCCGFVVPIPRLPFHFNLICSTDTLDGPRIDQKIKS